MNNKDNQEQNGFSYTYSAKEQAELIQRVMQADPDTVRLTLDILKRIDKK